MDRRAVIKAKQRLQMVEQIIERMQACANFEEFDAVWYQFLTAAKNIYTVLEIGSKVSPRSRQWFGSIVSQRRKDPLLQYVFQARNDTEHGLEPILSIVQQAMGVTVAYSGSDFSVEFNMRVDEKGKLFVEDISSDSREPAAQFEIIGIKLADVHDRANTTYAPPRHHLGLALSGNSPTIVAVLTHEYLSKIVVSAEALA